ncbi:MAG: ArsC family reductase [Pseudomonadota bacterium]
MSDLTLYGIKNCDTIKKARKWLEHNDVDYQFHDYRVDGVEKSLLKKWCEDAGWETLLNRRGTTWRKLPEADREGINEDRAIELMCEQPALIKRPVLLKAGTLIVGFSVKDYESLL